jgi:hypothetical protein
MNRIDILVYTFVGLQIVFLSIIIWVSTNIIYYQPIKFI